MHLMTNQTNWILPTPTYGLHLEMQSILSNIVWSLEGF